MAGTKFNIGNVMVACQKMNTARRNILSQLNNMKSTYGSIDLQYWSGGTRKVFHEKVFGQDGMSGFVGTMGTAQNGVCKALNDLLFELASYVCRVANNDSEYLANYSYLKPEMFADESVSITPVSTWIEYSQINTEDVALSSEVIFGLESKYNEYFNLIAYYISNFNAALTECMNTGIQDSTVSALGRVISLLDSKLNEFKSEITALLNRNTSVVENASAAEQAATQGNEAVARILASLDFD